MYNLDIDIILTLSSSSHPTQQLYALNHWWTHDSLELVGEDVAAQIKDAWLVRDQHQPFSALLSVLSFRLLVTLVLQYQMMQEVIPQWGCLMEVTGGALNLDPSKSYCFLVEYVWKRGRWIAADADLGGFYLVVHTGDNKWASSIDGTLFSWQLSKFKLVMFAAAAIASGLQLCRRFC